jgi:hypothetical protein
MKFNANSDSSAANAASPAAPSNSSAAPSVPIPVYRELAAELQATRVMLESINTKNQLLIQQNQQLRQDIERVVQLGFSLRRWIEPAPVSESAQPVSDRFVDQQDDRRTDRQTDRQESPVASSESTAEAAAIAAKLRDSMLISDQLFSEEPSLPHRSEVKPAKDLSGIWLALAILFIIATAFGAGFLVMKPFLSNR